MRYLCIPLILLVVGCAGSLETRSKVALAISCSTYAEALAQLTPMRKAGRLSPETVNRVSRTNTAITPICASTSNFDPARGISAVKEAIGLLRQIKEGT